MKSEPDCFSWGQFVKDGKASWDGVRNYQAANNLKAMQVGDEALFYHSTKELQVVGTMTITRTAYPDPTDETGRFVMVDVKPLQALKTPVTLKQIKSHPLLQQMAMVKQSRLSVTPVSAEEWSLICGLGGV